LDLCADPTEIDGVRAYTSSQKKNETTAKPDSIVFVEVIVAVAVRCSEAEIDVQAFEVAVELQHRKRGMKLPHAERHSASSAPRGSALLVHLLEGVQGLNLKGR
jgi:hypothetical protein